jgi:ABC-2 type transport system ATP-binding protein
MNNGIVVRAENLSKYFGGKCAVDHLNLSIPKGCICGLLGRNGAGKTTAIRMLLGFLEPTAGSSSLLGCDSQELTPVIRERVGYVTEGHRLYRYMTIEQLRGFQRSFFPGRWDDSQFGDMMDYFELSLKSKIKHLSNGQRAQVSLALAMAPNPELIIMDDPTLGLDAAIRRQFLEGMIHLIQSQGRTILFSSHILSDVERVASRIVVIDKGAVRADCTLEEFQKNVKKVIFKFAGGVPDTEGLCGLLHKRKNTNQLEAVVVGVSDEEVKAWGEKKGAEVVHFVEMNLEDKFIEYTQGEGGKRLFEWEKI